MPPKRITYKLKKIKRLLSLLLKNKSKKTATNILYLLVVIPETTDENNSFTLRLFAASSFRLKNPCKGKEKPRHFKIISVNFYLN